MEKYLETFRSWSSGDRIQETGDRRLFYLFSPHPTPHTLHPIHLIMELPELNIEIIWAIINDEIDDETVNKLVWQSLGYRYDESQGKWDNSQVEEDWRGEYPQPPDFIANRPPTVKLTRSILPENKQLLKDKLGFTGYKIGEFNPRMTRRATAANWLCFYALK